MRQMILGVGTLAAAMLIPGAASTQQAVKIGVVMSYSGQFADPGAQIDNGIKLFMSEHGDTVAGRKIEIIRKDSGGIAPDVAKRLSQEVIVRDGFPRRARARAALASRRSARPLRIISTAATGRS